MSKSTDWLPNGRAEMLTMANNWDGIMSLNKTAWSIPQQAINDIDGAAMDANVALTEALNETSRTPVATAKCKAAFEKLAAVMRDVKKRCFFVPPLTNADIVSLGLKPHDTTPTPSGVPTAQVTIETYLVGRHELGVKIVYVTGNPADAANKGYRIWYSVLNQGETPPANPDELKRSFYTKRKKDVIEFDYNDSGKTAYMAVQIENEGKKGPWGPLTSALIP